MSRNCTTGNVHLTGHVVWLLAAVVLTMLTVPPAVAQTPIPIAKISRSKPVDFEKDVLPILRKNCLACHSAKEADGELTGYRILDVRFVPFTRTTDNAPK